MLMTSRRTGGSCRTAHCCEICL